MLAKEFNAKSESKDYKVEEFYKSNESSIMF